MTFGIPIDVLPVTDDGHVKLTYHMKWMERRRVKERDLKVGRPFTGIDLPTTFDVLLGRGKPIQYHAGNVHLRHVIDNHRDKYDVAGRGGKAVVADTIVQLIKSSSRRFLKQGKNGWWYEVPDDVAREKVCSGFRTQGRKDRITMETLTVRNTTTTATIATEDGKRLRVA